MLGTEVAVLNCQGVPISQVVLKKVSLYVYLTAKTKFTKARTMYRSHNVIQSQRLSDSLNLRWCKCDTQILLPRCVFVYVIRLKYI